MTDKRAQAIRRAEEVLAKEVWNLMEQSEKAGGNGVTDALGLLGSMAAAVVDRCKDKAVGWQYLEAVITAAKRVGAELREEIDSGKVDLRRVPPEGKA